ncbi:MAG TPA: decaprenyl-phosphate phosphoribosyltransferase [Solirubrobacteraceae bacterium]|jgi:decaprenyl-phosphate phosphoribosyltransferase
MAPPLPAPPAEGSSAAAAATVAARRSRLPLAAMIQACRPRQWTKNLLVLAAPGAGGALLHAEVPGRLALTFACFCALSSATYLLNDIHDRAEDRVHPRRRLRPIASGRLPIPLAVVMAVGLALAGLGLAFAVRPWLAAVGGGYLALTTSYTLWWRSVAVADLAAISGGFVLRALAGGVATDVALSRWFLLVTSFGALFVIAGKRYAELRSTSERGSTRALLTQYSENYLRFVIGIAATVTTVAYCLWAFQRSHQARLSWYELTVVPLVLWLLRYGLLLEQGAGDAPEELVLRDRFLLTVTAAWLALFVAGVYVVS